MGSSPPDGSAGEALAVWAVLPRLLLGGLAITAAVVGLTQLSLLEGLLPVPALLGPGRSKKRPVRIYMDGCFDMMHYGHANALRQARALGDQLVVGINSDDEIRKNKGPPVMNIDERVVMVEAVKWVDEIIVDAPYAIDKAFMATLFDDYKIDYIIHGDDPCLLPDGTDAYAEVRKAGRFKQVKRTEGVSSTDIVGRMLLCVRDPRASPRPVPSLQRQFSQHGRESDTTRVSHFLPTSRRIVQFSNGKSPPPDAKIVYIDGAFDMFHAGHVEILRAARALGDFLLVGLHPDTVITAHRGPHHPIMNLHERSLSVLACRYVDEVVIGAPWDVTQDLLTTFNISLVVHGTRAEPNERAADDDPYALPKEMGIFRVIDSSRDITTSTIIKRIWANHESYMARNEKKQKSEAAYLASKSYVSES
ncbi:CTP:phosphorylethanolamine cytidyltransferase [Klebsormidium nitens]|uniref:ethanolamine-phosphate cytidylyltransferase n=1 Tax=Klebsormidium nitens TaxID=105231 RepID=A0A1Y1IWH7_KLENI|nr:CTP:phosphorylethanolamine cytidyltransferase [Klebsormidium nitens]|eukprot:GAQ92628.1 CTP:phosphorylethanolamine cytidyltransferase [Klebsormidium nitens]